MNMDAGLGKTHPGQDMPLHTGNTDFIQYWRFLFCLSPFELNITLYLSDIHLLLLRY